LRELYDGGIRFLTRNLRKIQVETDFNSPGVLEIAQSSCAEALVNALIHRDYFIDAPVKILLFDNRLEIISPGGLPGRLTVMEIQHGVSQPRNPVLHSLAQDILPYTGMGTGVSRILSGHPSAKLETIPGGRAFRVVFPRDTAPVARAKRGESGAMTLRETSRPYRFGSRAEILPDPEIYFEDIDSLLDDVPVESQKPTIDINRAFDDSRFPLIQRYILEKMQENERVTAHLLADGSGKGIATINRHLKKLKEQKIIIRHGADKNGYWEVVLPDFS